MPSRLTRTAEVLTVIAWTLVLGANCFFAVVCAVVILQ